MKVSDHKKAVETLLQRKDQPEFCRAFLCAVAARHPSVFNKVCDYLVWDPLSPCKEEWKIRVKAFLAGRDKIAAIKWLRTYSVEHPDDFGAKASEIGIDGKPHGLGLKDAKDLVESLNDPAENQ